LQEYKVKNPLDLFKEIYVESPINISVDASIMINELITFINNGNRLDDIAIAFASLRYLSVDIKTFDFDNLKKVNN
jgi:hypothetical protein